MSKSEFADHLTHNGYPATVESGIVRISKPLSEADAKAVKKLMQEAGLSGSYGYRCLRR